MAVTDAGPAATQENIRSTPRYIYALIVCTALIITVTISYSTYLGNRSAHYLLPLVHAAHEVRTSSALAHLWAEEFLLKDPDVKVDDIMNNFDRANQFAEAMLDGGTIGGNNVPAAKDSELRDILQVTQTKIADCKKITENRFFLADQAVVGTDIDQAFDSAFDDLLKTSMKVDARLNTVIKHDTVILHSLQSGLVVTSFILAVIAGIMVCRTNRKRTGYLLTIEEKNRQLNAMNQQLTAAEQQLKASNQQLVAGEQQLRAANQQLTASEQQLRAANQQLTASEKALRKSEKRYRSLFSDMAEGVALHRVIYDSENRPVNYEIINVNPQYETILGIPREQVVGKTATEAYSMPAPPFLSEYAHAAETGTPFRFETYLPPMNRHFDISVSSFEKGHFATIFSDITARKKAEEAIHQNAERLEILWETSQYRAVTVSDLLDYALERAIQLTDSKIGYIYFYDEEEKKFILNSWSKDVMKECAVQKKQTIYYLEKTGIWGEAVRQAKPIILNDYQAPHPLKKGYPEGHSHLFRFMTIPVFIDNSIKAVVGVANKAGDYDESDVKQLTLFMDSVWKLVEKNHADEERIKLQTQMQKLQSLGILAGGIAHDFNNILTAILANINIVNIRAKGDERIGTRLTEAEKACYRARDLTQQLLTFARGGVPVKRAVRADHVIRDSAQFALRGSSVVAEFDFPDDLWSMDADEGQVGQVIGNLSINSMQAMPMGGTICFRAENVNIKKQAGVLLKGGPYVKITVKDSGIGIPREYLQKIFDPYFTTKQDGNGLGLAIAHSIITRHDGLIDVTSEPGNGTTFHLYIPASSDAIPEEKSTEEISDGRGSILLMDDEEIVSKAAGAVLQEYGYNVSFARDGDETLRLYSQMKDTERPFDLVIMDLTIKGGMGGKETIQELLKMDPQAKAVVSSGYSNDPVMADFRSYGFRGMISKPYKLNELFETIRSVINE